MRFASGAAFVAAIAAVAPAHADLVCADSSYCVVTLGPSGKDRLTIDPGPLGGESWSQLGITIRVYLRDCNGDPVVGLPAEAIVLSDPALCICPGGNIADAATDIDGSASFSSSLNGGGCAADLAVFVNDVPICSTGLKTNSPDSVPASPCFVDASDLAVLAGRLGCSATGGCPPTVPGPYTICSDWNEDGVIDASDGAHYAWSLGSNFCP